MQQRNFIDSKSFSNLEIGAGCGNFGKIFYPQCYLTDNDMSLSKSCDTCHIDWFCDVHDLTWKEDRFEHLIMCNPYKYGFINDESTEKLMNELLRVIKKTDTKIIMICRHDNKFCNPKRVKTRIAKYLEKNNRFKLTVDSYEIDSKTEYKDYIFRATDRNPTIPNCKIIIHVNE